MADQQALHYFEHLLELTREMLSARQAGDWDLIGTLQAERLAEIQSFQDAKTSIAAQDKEKIRQICLSIQAIDQEILDEAIVWRAQIKQFIM